MGKLQTPDWIKEGYDSPVAYAKARQKAKPLANSSNPSQVKGSSNSGKSKKPNEKTFKIRRCPKCNGDNVNVVLTGEEKKETGEWECKKCKWHGKDIEEEELTEDEFMKYLDDKEEPVA